MVALPITLTESMYCEHKRNRLVCQGYDQSYPPLNNNKSPNMNVPETKETISTDPKLLELLVCPLTKTSLQYDADKQELISRAARLAFPIRDGIPVLLEAEARKLEEGE